MILTYLCRAVVAQRHKPVTVNAKDYSFDSDSKQCKAFFDLLGYADKMEC